MMKPRHWISGLLPLSIIAVGILGFTILHTACGVKGDPIPPYGYSPFSSPSPSASPSPGNFSGNSPGSFQ